MNKNKLFSQSGVSLIELMVALASAMLVVVAITSLLLSSSRIYRLANNRTEAVNIASQSMEISFMLKNKNWENFYALVGGEYHIVPTDNSWNYVAGPAQEGLYIKRLYIEPVYRDNLSRIAATGEVDTNMVKIRSVVSYDQQASHEIVELASYISR